MIQNCKMRHENGNCLPAGGFCTANKNICEALQNAYEMGQRNVIHKKGEWIGIDDYPHEDWECSVCGSVFCGNDAFREEAHFCPTCGADMRKPMTIPKKIIDSVIGYDD